MLLYLDIDGVMIPANSWRRPKILEDGFPEFSSKAVKSLVRIISSSSATIVLTTSHKHKYTLKEWNTIFRRRNISVNKITRLPKNTNHLNRKDELIHWFNAKHLKDKFLIIDDDKSLNNLNNEMKNKLILTELMKGFNLDKLNEAIEYKLS